mgnify:CR=1 FL=1
MAGEEYVVVDMPAAVGNPLDVAHFYSLKQSWCVLMRSQVVSRRLVDLLIVGPRESIIWLKEGVSCFLDRILAEYLKPCK